MTTEHVEPGLNEHGGGILPSAWSCAKFAEFLHIALAANEGDAIGMGRPTFNGRFRRWKATLAGLRALGGGTDEWTNYYFCSSVLDGRGRKKKNAVRTQAIFVDLDYGKAGHRKPSPFPDRDTALAHLLAMPILPACIWDTGHGLQACWLLDAPVNYADQVVADQLDEVRAVIYAATRSDSTSSRVNLFRVPGSWNDKSAEFGCPPVQGWIVQDLDTSRRYSLAELEAAFRPLAPDAHAIRTSVAEYAGDIEFPADLGISPELDAFLRSAHAGKDRSAVFHGAVLWLADLGATPTCMVQILAPLPWVPQRYADRLLDEINRCLAKRKSDDLDGMVLELEPPHPIVEWSLADLGLEE